jgi:hypothetical protein
MSYIDCDLLTHCYTCSESQTLSSWYDLAILFTAYSVTIKNTPENICNIGCNSIRNLKCSGFRCRRAKSSMQWFPYGRHIGVSHYKKRKEYLPKMFIVSKISCHIMMPPDPAFIATNLGSNASDGHFVSLIGGKSKDSHIEQRLKP